MKLVWSKRSQQHLQLLFEYIAEADETAARMLVSRVIKLSETILLRHPESGRVGRVSDTRELVIFKTPYIVAYKMKNETVFIIAVWHSSRSWPSKF